MRVRLARLAQGDVVQARDWYEAQRIGLGVRFIDAMNRVLTRVGDNPVVFPVVHGHVRRAFVGRFPYDVYFEVARDHVRVVAVVHLRRAAETWRRRSDQA